MTIKEKHTKYIIKNIMCYRHYVGYKYSGRKLKSILYYILHKYYDRKELKTFLKM